MVTARLFVELLFNHRKLNDVQVCSGDLTKQSVTLFQGLIMKR